MHRGPQKFRKENQKSKRMFITGHTGEITVYPPPFIFFLLISKNWVRVTSARDWFMLVHPPALFTISFLVLAHALHKLDSVVNELLKFWLCFVCHFWKVVILPGVIQKLPLPPSSFFEIPLESLSQRVQTPVGLLDYVLYVNVPWKILLHIICGYQCDKAVTKMIPGKWYHITSQLNCPIK